MNSRTPRRGYAMVLIMVFIVLVNLCLVLSYKHFDAAIRVQSVYRETKARDEGALLALAAGIAMLEKNTPQPDEFGFLCYGISFNASGEPQYKITYAQPDPVGEPLNWTVTAERQTYRDDTLRDLKTQYPNVVSEPEPPAE